MLTRFEIECEIHKFLQSIEYPVKKGICLDRSSEFINRLLDLGHSCMSIQFGWLGGQSHSWVEVWSDDMPLTLVDFTASQFGYQKLIKGTIDEIFDVYEYKYDM